MKKLSLFVCAITLAALLSQGALAQRRMAGPGGPGGQGMGGGGQRPNPLSRLTTELGLSQHQQNVLKPAYDSYRQQMMALRGSPNARDKMQAIRTDMEAKIMKVLTPAQQHKFHAMGGLRSMMGGGGMGMMRDLDQLNLTAAQKKKLDPMMKKMRDQMEAFRASHDTSDAARTKSRAMFEDFRKQLDKILNAAQKQKLEQLRQNRGNQRGGGRPNQTQP